MYDGLSATSPIHSPECIEFTSGTRWKSMTKRRIKEIAFLARHIHQWQNIGDAQQQDLIDWRSLRLEEAKRDISTLEGVLEKSIPHLDKHIEELTEDIAKSEKHVSCLVEYILERFTATHSPTEGYAQHRRLYINLRKVLEWHKDVCRFRYEYQERGKDILHNAALDVKARNSGTGSGQMKPEPQPRAELKKMDIEMSRLMINWLKPLSNSAKDCAPQELATKLAKDLCVKNYELQEGRLRAYRELYYQQYQVAMESLPTSKYAGLCKPVRDALGNLTPDHFLAIFFHHAEEQHHDPHHSPETSRIVTSRAHKVDAWSFCSFLDSMGPDFERLSKAWAQAKTIYLEERQARQQAHATGT